MRSVICVGVLLTGCFYLDPINKKPEIHSVDCKITNREPGKELTCFPGGSVRRGDLVQLELVFTDPDRNKGTASFDWKAFHCTGGAELCDKDPFRTTSEQVFAVEVPKDLFGAAAIKVNVELRDELGATAGQTPLFYINDPPSLKVRATAHAFVVGGPIELSATVGDPDEGPDTIDVTWDVIAPVPSAVPLEDRIVPQNPFDPTVREIGKTIVPDRAGDWIVRVRATDTLRDTRETHEEPLPFSVGPDQPPCLAQSQPLVPPEGASLPIADPTLFQVAVVTDDLDPYPALSGPHFGATEFRWSMLAPGSPGRQVLTGATGNSIDFDPGAFTPGDIVELRVEIFDRHRTEITCPDGDATCAVAAPTSCIQRQTWRVEVR